MSMRRAGLDTHFKLWQVNNLTRMCWNKIKCEKYEIITKAQYTPVSYLLSSPPLTPLPVFQTDYLFVCPVWPEARSERQSGLSDRDNAMKVVSPAPKAKDDGQERLIAPVTQRLTMNSALSLHLFFNLTAAL